MINATKFVNELSTALEEFCADLEQTPWNDPKWDRVRHKMDAIAEHCTMKP